MQYLLITHGEAGDPSSVTICETEALREKATLAAIYGKPEDVNPEAAAKELANLRESGWLRFEGDPPLQWVSVGDGGISFECALFPTCEAVGTVRGPRARLLRSITSNWPRMTAQPLKSARCRARSNTTTKPN